VLRLGSQNACKNESVGCALPIRWHIVERSDVCLGCPSNSDSAEASDSPADCIYNAGFSGVRGELCTQCAVAKFRAAP